MIDQVKYELEMLLNVDYVKGLERHKIEAICNDFLNKRVYLDEVSKSLDNLFSQPDFDFKSEVPMVLLNLIKLNDNVEYYKEITQGRSKYLIYTILFYYLIKNQTDIINSQNIGQLRLLFSNCWDLVSVVGVHVIKRSHFSCIGQCIPFFKSGKISI